MKENIYRSIYCGEVDASYVGKEIKLAGWVNSIRNLGGLLFITLRDETGIVQLISEEVDKYIGDDETSNYNYYVDGKKLTIVPKKITITEPEQIDMEVE